jgi:tetratricopeptide (TPR) repeat protein
MDCRMPILAALCLTTLNGCVTTQPTSQAPVPADPPAHAKVQKAADGPKRPPLPGTYVALAIIKEREADKSKDAAQQMKSYDEARKYFQEALKLDAHYRDAVQGLARVYARMEDYSHALEIYEKALDKSPKDHGMWFDMGMCYCRKKELVRAVPCFQRALQLDPENRQYMKTVGFALARCGQTEQALDVLTQAMGSALAHYNIARMMDHMGQADLCARHLDLALQMNPNLEQARDMLEWQEMPRPLLQFSE